MRPDFELENLQGKSQQASHIRVLSCRDVSCQIETSMFWKLSVHYCSEMDKDWDTM
jgi:hypothetical protein